MTGRKFLELSATVIKDWIEKQKETLKISQTLDLYRELDKRKIIKWPVRRIDRYGNNDIEHWQITVSDGKRFTYVLADLINLRTFIVNHVEKWSDDILIVSYDRP
jgi:predicted transport protein